VSTRGAALRSLLVPALVALPCLAMLIGLGVWQLERLAWKQGLIATVEARVHQPAQLAPAEPDWSDVTYDADEYRHVTVSGRLHNDKEVQVYALIDAAPDGTGGGPGYWVLTPLVQPDGAAFLVNRGFVPLDRKAPATRPEGQVDGPVTITGLLRMPEEEGLFTPENDPAKDSWYTRDPDAIAAAKGLLRVAPFIIDADATPNPGGLPVGGLTKVTFPNRHLEYALTWFGLAATLVGVFVAFAFARLRRPREGEGTAGLTASE
jgi:surfeit locus 1 family protein